MMSRNERMEKLNKAGINTGKYFNINIPEGLAPGSTISVIINENGQPMIVGNNAQDSVRDQIIEDGYVRNTKLHRRFVMAQMFNMLNYVSCNGKYNGYNDYLKHMYSYDYTIKMMMEEIRVLSKLEVRDAESFNERVHFFDKDVVVAVLEDYLEKLKKYVESLHNRNCKGVPYKRIKGMNVFNEDLNKKIYHPVRAYIVAIKHARNYKQIYELLESFMRTYIKLPYDTPKSKVWIDAFKGDGAYYTLKNLVMFHDCKIYNDYGFPMYGEASSSTGYVQFLNSKLDEYYGQGWRMFALMKKVIDDNNFNFSKKMALLYADK